MIDRTVLLNTLRQLVNDDPYGHAEINRIINTYINNDEISSYLIVQKDIEKALKDFDIYTNLYLIKNIQEQNKKFNRDMYQRGVFHKIFCQRLMKNCSIVMHLNNVGNYNVLMNGTSRMPIIYSDLLTAYKNGFKKNK